MSDRNKKPPMSTGDILRALEGIWHGVTLRNAIVLMIALAYEREIRRLRQVLDKEPTLYEKGKCHNYFKANRLVKPRQKRGKDNRKIEEATTEDGGRSEDR